MEYILKIKDTDIAVLNAGLMSLPYGQVAGLVSKLQKQISEQDLANSVENKEE
jgi:hypothetical protein